MNIIEWLRQYRIGEFAIFDFAISFLGVYLIAPFLSKIFLKLHISIPKKNWLYLTLPIGILAHIVASSITPMTRDFLDLQGHYVLKFFIIGLFVLGLHNISKTN